MLYDEAELLDQVRRLLPSIKLADRWTKEGCDETEVLARARDLFLKHEPVATVDAPLAELEKLPVIAGDDVALYVSALGFGTDMSDVVASIAPPFDQFFIEFQRVPSHLGLYAWGAHFTATSDKKEIEGFRPCGNGYPRWVLKIHVYLERQKGKPFGPVASPRMAHGSNARTESFIGQAVWSISTVLPNHLNTWTRIGGIKLRSYCFPHLCLSRLCIVRTLSSTPLRRPKNYPNVTSSITDGPS